MNKEQIFSDSFLAMGTRCDVVLTGVEQVEAEQVFQLIKKEVDDLEQSLSPLVFDSSVSLLNEAKRNVWTKVPDDLWDVLTICYDFYQMSNGAFDITISPLIELWKYSESPTEEEILSAKKISGFDKVEFDFENQKIKFSEESIQFYFGEIGKGIVLDTLKPILIDKGIENGIISFEESSILAIGKHLNGENWPLGIRNNLRMHEFVHVFSATNETVTTSGSILTSDEGVVQNRNRVISPESGLSVDENKTVSVKADSATMGSFLSIAWMVLPENDRNILSEQLKNIEILEVEYSENNYKTKLTIL